MTTRLATSALSETNSTDLQELIAALCGGRRDWPAEAMGSVAVSLRRAPSACAADGRSLRSAFFCAPAYSGSGSRPGAPRSPRRPSPQRPTPIVSSTTNTNNGGQTTLKVKPTYPTETAYLKFNGQRPQRHRPERHPPHQRPLRPRLGLRRLQHQLQLDRNRPHLQKRPRPHHQTRQLPLRQHSPAGSASTSPPPSPATAPTASPSSAPTGKKSHSPPANQAPTHPN